MRLFLDANVLFTAAHNPNGKAALIIALEAEGAWELATSQYAVEEAHRNLELKFSQVLDRLTALLHGIRVVRHQPTAPYPEGLATKDRPIFQAAYAARATHLLTGDLRDFGVYMNKPEETFGICIQTVSEFLLG